MLTAADVIRALELKPHPEGGHYRETFRDSVCDSEGRSRSSAIFFLLQSGECSRWHRIDAAEVWHHYAGAPLCLEVVDAIDARHQFRLGPEIAHGEQPQAVVAAQTWQRAHSLGDWTLVGCTVAPAFDFARFELAPAGFNPGLGLS